MNADIDVFLSYARTADDGIAPALKQGLARLAKPWSRPRALRVFRDRTDLSAAHDLTAEIEDALRRSRYFVLLASPQAAQSHWVGKEIE
ncbi:toll/interleukin-1 receptor domain-containing protein [Nocardia niwae]|uniref:toll/interleukin-1 receptor domain-containing protein n=1 Tax=Nocardia niwae TaxID=626084 RepID=UPI0033CF071A